MWWVDALLGQGVWLSKGQTKIPSRKLNSVGLILLKNNWLRLQDVASLLLSLSMYIYTFQSFYFFFKQVSFSHSLFQKA